MAYNQTPVQEGANGANGDIDVDIGGQATDGNLLVACVATRGSTKPAMATGQGAAWSEAVSVQNTLNIDWLSIYYKLAGASEPTDGIYTCECDVDQNAAWIGEYSGAPATDPLDQVASEAQTNEGTKDTGTTPTTTQADEIAIAAWFCRADITPTSYGDSYTEEEDYVFTSGNSTNILVATKLLTATGTQASSVTVSEGSGVWLAAIATFKAGLTTGDEALQFYQQLIGA